MEKTPKSKKFLRERAVEKFKTYIDKWLTENSLGLSHENIRRYFAMKHPTSDVSETSIKLLYIAIKSDCDYVKKDKELPTKHFNLQEYDPEFPNLSYFIYDNVKFIIDIETGLVCVEEINTQNTEVKK